MPTPTAPPKPVLCPECGTPDNAPSRSLIRRHRLYPLIPRAVLALALLTVIAWVWFGRHEFTYAAGAPQRMEVARVAVITWEQLQAAANGQSDGFLTRSARSAFVFPRWSSLSPTPTLAVAVIAPAGDVSVERSIGWPSRLVHISDAARYEDFRTKKGPGPSSGGRGLWPTSVWQSGSLEIYSGDVLPGPTSRRITLDLYGACFLLLATLIAAWIAKRLLAPLLRLGRQPERTARTARLMGLGAAMAFLLFASVCTALNPDRGFEYNPLSMSQSSELVDLEYTQAGLAEAAADSRTDGAIARRAIEKIPFSTSPNALVKFMLAAPITSPGGEVVMLGPLPRPWLSIQTNTFYWDDSSFSFGWSGIWSHWRTRDGQIIISIWFAYLAPIILLLILSHFLTTRTTRFLLLRSAISRQRKHLCQRCAYPLPITPSPLAAASPPAP